MPIESINAITLVTRDMKTSVQFYEALGFRLVYGGPASRFSSLAGSGDCFVNLTREDEARDTVSGTPAGGGRFWGRVILHVTDVDALFARAREAGFETETRPRDAAWGERYFHIRDPDGHELSFAKRLA